MHAEATQTTALDRPADYRDWHDCRLSFHRPCHVADAGASRHRLLERTSDRPVTRLEKKLQNGEATLSYARNRLGYLPSLLHNLNINADSQIRVFSKPSFRPLVLWLFCYYPVGAPGVASPKRTMISVFTSTNIPSRTVGL
jgi:hypothetical protein